MRQWEPNHRVHTGRSSNGVGDVDWYIGDASRRRWPWTTAPLTLETLDGTRGMLREPISELFPVAQFGESASNGR